MAQNVEPKFEDVFRMSEERFKKMTKHDNSDFDLSKSALKEYTKEIKNFFGYKIIKRITARVRWDDDYCTLKSINIFFYPNAERDCERSEEHGAYPKVGMYKLNHFTSFKEISNMTTVGEIMYYIAEAGQHGERNTDDMKKLYNLINDFVLKIYPGNNIKYQYKKKNLPNLMMYTK